MLTIEKIDSTSKSQRNRFVMLPFQFYKDTPQWVPPIRMAADTMVNKDKHPFYEHSDGDFFIAVRDGEDVGRIGVMENRLFNQYHSVKIAQFYLFECEQNIETAQSLFERAFQWAQARELDTMVGPKGLGPVDGYGMLEAGFEHRAIMTMTSYNHPYLPEMMGEMGFDKENDFISCYLSPEKFKLPERVHRIAERVKQRGALRVQRFTSKRELRAWAPKIAQTYQKAFINNWEYYPMTENELDFVIDDILTIAIPKLIKIIAHGDEVVGFVFPFPDLSAAIQRSKGRLFPIGIFDLLLEMRRTDWVALNGAGILPEFQGRGGNALLYAELENTMSEFNFQHATLVQVAETAVEMRSDLENLGSKPYINHRVYSKKI